MRSRGQRSVVCVARERVEVGKERKGGKKGREVLSTSEGKWREARRGEVRGKVQGLT